MDQGDPHESQTTNICGAKTRSGVPCKKFAMPNGRCRLHGGLTPRGFALPQTKTGRWSKDLPTRLMARYLESENDPDLLSVRQDIRLLDVLLQDNMSRLDSGESAQSWDLMRKAVDDMEDGINGEDYKGIKKALRKMRDVIDQRIEHFATEGEIRSKLEQRRKLVETEQKITLIGEQAITAEKALLFVGAIAGILKTRIHDTTILAGIQQDISLLLNVPEIEG